MYLKSILSLLVLLGPANTGGMRTTEMLVPLPEQPVRSFTVTESEFVEKLRKPLGRKKILAAPVKVETGAAVKSEASGSVKTEASGTVKTDAGAVGQSESVDGKSASLSVDASKDTKISTAVGEAVASAVDYKIADEKSTKEVPILLQLYRTPAGKLTAVRLRVPFDWRQELVVPGKLALMALVPTMNDKERRAATEVIATAHAENDSFGMADYQHQEVLVKYTGWKDKTRDYAILDFCLPPQDEAAEPAGSGTEAPKETLGKDNNVGNTEAPKETPSKDDNSGNAEASSGQAGKEK